MDQKEIVPDVPHFDYESVSDFAVTDRFCFMADAKGMFMVYERGNWSHATEVEAYSDEPRLMSVGNLCIAIGHWGHEIQVWNSDAKPIQTWALPRGFVSAVASFGGEGLIAYQKQRPLEDPLDGDRVHLLPTKLLRVDSLGHLDSSAQEIEGSMTLLAYNGKHIAYALSGESTKMHLMMRDLTKHQTIQLTEDIEAMATSSNGQIFCATDAGILEIKGEPGSAIAKRFSARGRNDLQYLDFACTDKHEFWGSTYEGVLETHANGKSQKITTARPARIRLVEGDLWVLENENGLQKIGEKQEWLIKFPNAKSK